MKVKWVVLSITLLMSSAFAQTPATPAPFGMPAPKVEVKGSYHGPKPVFFMRNQGQDMGKWWESSDVAKKLQLSDDQIKKLNDTFYDHRLKLIDYQAEVEKQNLKLQRLLDEDNPDESQVGAQVDQELAARGHLEREFTMMNLDLRKVLSVAQWKQLKAMKEDRGPGGDMFFFQKMHGPMPPKPPVPPMGPQGEMIMPRLLMPGANAGPEINMPSPPDLPSDLPSNDMF